MRTNYDDVICDTYLSVCTPSHKHFCNIFKMQNYYSFFFLLLFLFTFSERNAFKDI